MVGNDGEGLTTPACGSAGQLRSAADPYALKRRAPEAVQRAIWEQKHAANPNLPPPAQLEITAEEEAAMIKKMYDDQFPPGTRFGAPVPPPPPMAPPPPPPEGFFSRFFASISGRAEREAKRSGKRAASPSMPRFKTRLRPGCPLIDA
jgi:hypothetical protein